MKIFTVVTAKQGVALDAFLAFIQEEEMLVWSWVKQGYIQQIVSRQDAIGAIVEFNVESVEMAKSLIAQMPGIKHGLLEAVYFPAVPFVGFEVLFDDKFKQPAS